MTPPIAFPLAEAAKLTGLSISTLRKAINATHPPYLAAKRVGKGGKILVRADDLTAYIESLPDA